MSDKIKNIVISFVFFLCIIGGMFVNIFVKDTDISSSERRKLTKFPAVSLKTIFDGSFMNKFNDYAVEQFVLRDSFRSIKAYTETNLFKKQDNNGLYVIDGAIYKLEDKLNESEALRAANKINEIKNKYLNGMKVYYTIIPEKTYYLEKTTGLPAFDFDRMVEILNDNIKGLKYIDITGSLTLDDYYRTDTHWKQESIGKVVDKISKEMKFNHLLKSSYTIKEVKDFYGVYYGQALANVEPDTIRYKTNDILEDCQVYNYETNSESKVYNLNKLTSLDKYDIYLSGATPLLKVENRNAKTDKKLIVFRDSFGSSIVPLFIEAYSEIMVVDIRYMPSDILADYIKFENQDVLFIYCASVINSSSILR